MEQLELERLKILARKISVIECQDELCYGLLRLLGLMQTSVSWVDDDVVDEHHTAFPR